MHIINTLEDANNVKLFLKEDGPFDEVTWKDNQLYVEKDLETWEFDVSPEFLPIFKEKKQDSVKKVEETPITDKYDPLIFGKDQTEGVVAVEIVDRTVVMYLNDGSTKELDNYYWLLAPVPYDRKFRRLEGNLHYRYIRTCKDIAEFAKIRGKYLKKDIYTVFDPQEAAMILHGVTLFKGLKVSDVSVLSFDIETTGITHNENSKVLLITNTYRDESGKVTKRHFRVDNYDDYDVDMIKDWCKWVQEINPTIINGHNIIGYDLPYLSYCAKRAGYELELGRDCSPIKYNKRHSKFRVDGAQTWEYFKARIHGRQIIDGMFLAVKYDFGRKYPSWGLKPIAEFEGLVKEDRQFYDASKIRDNWHDLEEREKIVSYGIDDSDDSLALYDLMISSYFYYTQSIPKSFQSVNNSATGSQINAFLVRSYLQDLHSIPKAEERRSYGGGISFGNPGVWKNVNKVDVASLYPSIMITYEVYDKEKDPDGKFLQMVKYFTKQRLENKQKAKETNDPYYKAVEQAQKIVINSAYGMMGTPGLNFNSFDNADFVTTKGREILTKGMEWVESNDYKVVNVDTDSFSYTTGKRLTDEEFNSHIVEINKLFDDGIIWEDDGRYKAVLVVKAKNYALLSYSKKDKVKIKGSALKATMKEKALVELNRNTIDLLLNGKKDRVFDLYNIYCGEVVQDSIDISRWASKKTVTHNVLHPERPNEQKILDAIGDRKVQEGDKIRVYFISDGSIKIDEDYSNDHSKDRLLGKIYKTMKVFQTVIDIDMLPDYSLKRNLDLKDKL